MQRSHHESKNWFDQGGQVYARFRPEYPAELAAYLASVAPNTRLAVDVGCGNGQLSTLLAAHFERVVGLDPSADQLQHAQPHERLHYQCANAERLPLQAHSVNLISAAQAAHWFDLPRFYQEVQRVAAPGAILALISYGVLQLEGALGERFTQFYWDEIGPYWPAERKLVDSGYATLDFPFSEFSAPPLQIERQWDLAQLLGYISTWSALCSARETGQEVLLHNVAHDLSQLWGDPQQQYEVRWPITMRIARL